MNIKKIFLSFILFLLIAPSFCLAQKSDDTEFQKGWVLWAKLNAGQVTNFHLAPDLGLLGVQVNPQVTIVEHLIRAGANVGFVYVGKQTSLLLGPSVAFKIKTFNAESFGSFGDLQAIAEYNWGNNNQRLIGAGIGVELLQKILLSVTAQRDYNLDDWWLQSHISISLLKKKNKVPDFNK
jgi:hypothetical protein